MMAEGKTVVYANMFRSREVIEPVKDRAGAGEISCWDCGGTGIYEMPEEQVVCPRCKGAGVDYVSI